MSNRRDLPRFAPHKPFRRTTESAAAANKKHSNHIGFPSCKGTICRDLPRFALGADQAHTIQNYGPKWQIVANRGKSRTSFAVKS